MWFKQTQLELTTSLRFSETEVGKTVITKRQMMIPPFLVAVSVLELLLSEAAID